MSPTLSSRRCPTPEDTARGNFRSVTEPPSLHYAADSRWQRLIGWFLAPSPLDAAPAPNQLGAVREDFHASLADLTAVPDAGNLVARIEQARTLREFWHLRADVYRLVALQHSQSEAETRLDDLNRHFTLRSARSRFSQL